MSTITLVGLDGAGKTTIARLLMESSPRRVKYLYMGTAIGSSNHALPTSRLVHYVRAWRSRAVQSAERRELRPLEQEDVRGSIAAAIRLLHRLSEEWYRQLVSWFYQVRGFVVLHDRHFIFECAPNDVENPDTRRLSDRLHYWLLCHAYPTPQLVFFLDASPEILFARKPEASLEYLAARRKIYVEVGMRLPRFIRIDATQSPDAVLKEIESHLGSVYVNQAKRHDTDMLPGSKRNE